MFCYETDNLIENIKDVAEICEKTDFDEKFERKWTYLHDIGVFRYKLNIEKEKILQGQYGFLFQLNIERSINRRTPEKFQSINQPFQQNKFHFAKVSKEEYIFELKNVDNDIDDAGKHVIMINTSPICYGHSLFCPSIDDFLPQVMTVDSLKLALNIMFLSSNRNLRMGFNSLCGMASVNNLHYHILILDHRLPVETAECYHLKGPLYEMTKYPAKCFCFEISMKLEISNVSNQVLKLVNYLVDNNIAHNVYLTRGDSFDNSKNSIIRILVWARKSAYGAKEISAFNLAICEFSGQFPIKNSVDFERLNEDDVIQYLEDATSSVFYSIREKCIELYQ